MKKEIVRVVITILLVAVSVGVSAVRVDAATNVVDEQVQKEAKLALARGMLWLESQQTEEGRIGPEKYPAVTALAIAALRANGSTNAAVLSKAEQYLHSFLGKPVSDPLMVYNARICRSVLGVGGQDSKPTKAQNKWEDEWSGVDRDYSISAREFELRQIALQKERAELVKKGKSDPDRLMAERIASNIVNPPKAAEKRASDEKAPVVSKRRGYGRMSYEGMMRLIDEDVAPEDPRVDAMLDWAERGFTLDERAGMGQAGIYFFYYAMAKCLNASGEFTVQPMLGGSPVQWREQVIRKMVSLQKSGAPAESGFWVNSSAAYMEDDPVLVTAYALLTIGQALGGKR